MRILLTSGGTKVPIDRVRSITNMSRGTFGAKIARQLLQYEDVCLTYLGAKEFEMPFSCRVDFGDSTSKMHALEKVLKRARLESVHGDCYRQVEYKTFDEYAKALKEEMSQLPDIVVLTAAVSDYTTKPHPGKIRSDSDLNIELEETPKLIGKIKKWHPDCHLVGFKLLVNSTDEQLFDAANKSLEKNGCDFIVANDLRDIKAGKHRLLIVDKNGGFAIHQNTDDSDYLAKVIAEKVHSLGDKK